MGTFVIGTCHVSAISAAAQPQMLSRAAVLPPPRLAPRHQTVRAHTLPLVSFAFRVCMTTSQPHFSIRKRACSYRPRA